MKLHCATPLYVFVVMFLTCISFGLGITQWSCHEKQQAYLESEDRCYWCEVGFILDLQRGGCSVCRAGRFNNYDGAECNDCEGDSDCEYYCEYWSPYCLNCVSGTISSEGAGVSGERQSTTEACTSCTTGKYQYGKGKAVCDICGEGTFQNETGQTSCKDCPAGTDHNLEGQTSEDSCATTACSAGSYKEDGECKQCDAGTYQDEEGKTSCHDCPVGTYQGKKGQSSCSMQGGVNQDWECKSGWTREIDRCVPCLAGTEGGPLTIGDETRNVCRRCAVGTFKSIGMSPDDRCEGCPTGTYSATTGATQCTDCPAGQSTGSRNSASIDACTCGGVARRPVSAPPLLAESQSAVDFYASSGGLGHCMYENCP